MLVRYQILTEGTELIRKSFSFSDFSFSSVDIHKYTKIVVKSRAASKGKRHLHNLLYCTSLEADQSCQQHQKIYNMHLLTSYLVNDTTFCWPIGNCNFIYIYIYIYIYILDIEI